MDESVEIMVQRAGRSLAWGTQEPWPVRYPVFWLPYGLRREDPAADITMSESSGRRGSWGGACGILVPVGA
jgi:hypothetical protein